MALSYFSTTYDIAIKGARNYGRPQTTWVYVDTNR